MTLDEAASSCSLCAEALIERYHGAFDFGCLSCRARDCARVPLVILQREIAKDVKRARPGDFDSFIELRTAWLAHDAEARRAAA